MKKTATILSHRKFQPMVMQNWVSLQQDHGTHMLQTQQHCRHSNTAEF